MLKLHDFPGSPTWFNSKMGYPTWSNMVMTSSGDGSWHPGTPEPQVIAGLKWMFINPTKNVSIYIGIDP